MIAFNPDEKDLLYNLRTSNLHGIDGGLRLLRLYVEILAFRIILAFGNRSRLGLSDICCWLMNLRICKGGTTLGAVIEILEFRLLVAMLRENSTF